MALKLADINIGALVTDNFGKATAYFQRYLQTTNRQISDAIDTLIIQQAQIQQALDDAEQALQDVADLNVTLTNYLLGMGLGQANTSSGLTDTSGNVALPHNYVSDDYPVSLAACTVTPSGVVFCHPQITAVDSSYLYITVFDAGGIPLNEGFYSVSYRVGGI